MTPSTSHIKLTVGRSSFQSSSIRLDGELFCQTQLGLGLDFDYAILAVVYALIWTLPLQLWLCACVVLLEVTDLPQSLFFDFLQQVFFSWYHPSHHLQSEDPTRSMMLPPLYYFYVSLALELLARFSNHIFLVALIPLKLRCVSESWLETAVNLCCSSMVTMVTMAASV